MTSSKKGKNELYTDSSSDSDSSVDEKSRRIIQKKTVQEKKDAESGPESGPESDPESGPKQKTKPEQKPKKQKPEPKPEPKQKPKQPKIKKPDDEDASGNESEKSFDAVSNKSYTTDEILSMDHSYFVLSQLFLDPQSGKNVCQILSEINDKLGKWK